MSEQIVGEVRHAEVVTTLMDGTRILACRCREIVHEWRFRSHVAGHRRQSIVFRASIESSQERAGLDFSPRLHSPSETWPNGRRRSRPRTGRSAGSKR